MSRTNVQPYEKLSADAKSFYNENSTEIDKTYQTFSIYFTSVKLTPDALVVDVLNDIIHSLRCRDSKREAKEVYSEKYRLTKQDVDALMKIYTGYTKKFLELFIGNSPEFPETAKFADMNIALKEELKHCVSVETLKNNSMYYERLSTDELKVYRALERDIRNFQKVLSKINFIS